MMAAMNVFLREYLIPTSTCRIKYIPAQIPKIKKKIAKKGIPTYNHNTIMQSTSRVTYLVLNKFFGTRGLRSIDLLKLR